MSEPAGPCGPGSGARHLPHTGLSGRASTRLIAREQVDRVNLVRTWLLPFPNRKAYERILNYSSFCLSAGVTGLSLSRPDVVIATSPQLLVGLSGFWLARRKRVPFVFEVRDLWPESLAAVGMGNENSLLYKTLARVARFLYRHSDRVVVVSPAFEDYLESERALSAARGGRTVAAKNPRP